MVYWKTNRSAERLLSAIFAAHPNLRADSHAIATYYGEGATHVAIENRLRFHRKEGEKLQDEVGLEAYPGGRNPALTPRTPRGRTRKRGSNTLTNSSKKSKKCGYPELSDSDTESGEETPSKKPKVKAEKTGSTVLDPILLIGDEDFADGSDGNGHGLARFKAEDSQAVRIKKSCTPAPPPPPPTPYNPPRERPSPRARPSMAAILSQPRVDSQTCAFGERDLFICAEGSVRNRKRAENLERAKAHYADCDDSVYIV